jgi:heat shock protein 4
MSVIGIDFGDESLTVAAVRNGGIDVLQNEIGKRKTRSMVSYTSSQRFIADDAISHYLSNSANSVVFVKRLLGKMFDDVETAHEQHFSPARLVADDSGRVAIAVKYLGEDVIVTPEEVVATLLAKIKRTCRHCMPDQEIADCVIAIPHYFTDTQRRAMLDAARMAGLNVLRLVNDITAVATQYGMRRTFTADETRLVVFYDIGVCSTDVALASLPVTIRSADATLTSSSSQSSLRTSKTSTSSTCSRRSARCSSSVRSATASNRFSRPTARSPTPSSTLWTTRMCPAR